MPQTDDGLSRYLPLRPKHFHILLAMNEGARHGYSIKQEVEASTAGLVRLGPGTLYETLQRLESQGLTLESEAPPNGEREHSQRRYYELSELGRRVLEAEVRRLGAVADAARRRVLDGGRSR